MLAQPRERELNLEGELDSLHPDAWGWALVCCSHDREEARDVLQTSYLRILEGRARFNGSSSIRTWVFGIVRNTASEQRRRRHTRRSALIRWLRSGRERPSAPSPESVVGAAESQDHLRHLLERLSSRQRAVLHLVFYQDLSVEEAASVLGVTVGTARVHYERGKQRLRRYLSEKETP